MPNFGGRAILGVGVYGYSPSPLPGGLYQNLQNKWVSGGVYGAIWAENRGWGRLWDRLEGEFVKFYRV